MNTTTTIHITIITLLFFMLIFSVVYNGNDNANAISKKKYKERMKKDNEKREDQRDCTNYNNYMFDRAMKEGKMFYANIHCDQDEQWKYDKMNKGFDGTDKYLGSVLRNDAYGGGDGKDPDK